MIINKKITELLIEKGISPIQLAKRMDISKQNLLRILNGDDMKLSTIFKLSDKIGVEPSLFYEIFINTKPNE